MIKFNYVAIFVLTTSCVPLNKKGKYGLRKDFYQD